MHPFELIRAADVAQAIQGASKSSTAQEGAQVRFVGPGTTLIDLMKLNVEQPETVIDINRLPLNQVEALPDGGLKIGAVVRNSDLAYHRLLRAAGRINALGLWEQMNTCSCLNLILACTVY